MQRRSDIGEIKPITGVWSFRRVKCEASVAVTGFLLGASLHIVAEEGTLTAAGLSLGTKDRHWRSGLLRWLEFARWGTRDGSHKRTHRFP